MKRAIIMVIDSMGIGAMPDCEEFGDIKECNTLRNVCAFNKGLDVPSLELLGLVNIQDFEGINKTATPIGQYGTLQEKSKGKDTTTGHWEIAGVQSEQPLPTFPDGFPEEVITKFEELTGRKVICNKPYSGTQVLLDYGQEHVETGALIVYTSADSVFQIAAHEEVVPVEELYKYCEMAREMLVGEFGVGRVIARPFVGQYPEYKRTTNRHDYSLMPPQTTMLDQLKDNNYSVIAVGKINDIFAGKGITEFVRTKNNDDGMEKTIEFAKKEFEGLCFVNLVDFDMLYGHRNDAEGYANALTKFDGQITEVISNLNDEDILIITADHGCDPTTASTDHSREYTPMVMIGKKIKPGTNLGTRESFADIAATILEYFGVEQEVSGESFLGKVLS